MDAQDNAMVLVGQVFARCGAKGKFLAIEVTGNPLSAENVLTFVSPDTDPQQASCAIKRMEIGHMVANVAREGDKCCINPTCRKGPVPKIGWSVFISSEAAATAKQTPQKLCARPPKKHSQRPRTRADKAYFN